MDINLGDVFLDKDKNEFRVVGIIGDMVTLVGKYWSHSVNQSDLFLMFTKKDTDKDLYSLYTLPYGDAGYYSMSGGWEEEITKVQQTGPKCECGQAKVAGHEGDNPSLHSTWCPVYKNAKT